MVISWLGLWHINHCSEDRLSEKGRVKYSLATKSAEFADCQCNSSDDFIGEKLTVTKMKC